MKIGIIRPEALSLLLIIPLILFFQRIRSKGRPLTFPMYPLLQNLLSIQKPTHYARMSRKTRWFILSAIYVSLILILAGAHLVTTVKPPSQWLVVYDNISTLNAKTDKGTVREFMIDQLEKVTNDIPSKDAIFLLSLAPEPTFRSVDSRKELVEYFTKTPLSNRVPNINSTLTQINELTRNIGRLRVVLLSSRASNWQKSAVEAGFEEMIDETLVHNTITGNKGFTAFSLHPSIEGPKQYDLYFKVIAPDHANQTFQALLRTSDVLPTQIPVSTDEMGTAAVRINGITLLPGNLELKLDTGDHFSDDDAIVALINEPGNTVIRAASRLDPFMERAITSNPYFSYLGSKKDIRADVVITQIVPPVEIITEPILIVDPRQSTLGFRYKSTRDKPGEVSLDPIHPVSRTAVFKNFRPSRLFVFEPPQGFHIIARAGDVPLIMAGKINGVRTVVWAFNPSESGLVLDPSFIVLLRSTVEWLTENQPVVWEDSLSCTQTMSSGSSEGFNETMASNLLCPQISFLASKIDLQVLPDMQAARNQARELMEWDLTIPFLLSSFLLMLILIWFELFPR